MEIESSSSGGNTANIREVKMTMNLFERMREPMLLELNSKSEHGRLLGSNSIGPATKIERSEANDRGICWLNWPDESWSPRWYVSVRGQESLHIYLWIAKDLSWVQAYYYAGMVFGALSVAWMVYILGQAIRKRSLDEIWTTIAHVLWLVANFVWMIGELHDTKYPNAKSMYNAREGECGFIMMVALIWIGIYYAILKPMKLMNETTSRPDQYDTTGLKCRFSWFFKTWREYENFHILLWIGKDLAWNQGIGWLWIIFFIPTFVFALDFVWVSLYTKHLLIDHAHYVSIAIWVAANAVWAIANIWYPDYDEAWDMFASPAPREARLTGRYYSSWVVLLAFVPIVVMHVIWLYGTITHKIVDQDAGSSPKVLLSSLGKGVTSASIDESGY